MKAVPARDFRVAVVTSSKHEKRAVVRNRVRRRIYTIFRNENKTSALPFHILFYVAKKSYSASYADTVTAVTDLIKKIRASSRVV